MLEPVPSWGDVPVMNKHLRHLWTVVRLNRRMQPTVEWAVPAHKYGEDAAAAFEFELQAD